jgi:hypothetical protein
MIPGGPATALYFLPLRLPEQVMGVQSLKCKVEVQLPPQNIVDDSYGLYLPATRRPFGVLEWPALLRKLDKIDPSYRD